MKLHQVEAVGAQGHWVWDCPSTPGHPQNSVAHAYFAGAHVKAIWVWTAHGLIQGLKLHFSSGNDRLLGRTDGPPETWMDFEGEKLSEGAMVLRHDAVARLWLRTWSGRELRVGHRPGSGASELQAINGATLVGLQCTMRSSGGHTVVGDIVFLVHNADGSRPGRLGKPPAHDKPPHLHDHRDAQTYQQHLPAPLVLMSHQHDHQSRQYATQKQHRSNRHPHSSSHPHSHSHPQAVSPSHSHSHPGPHPHSRPHSPPHSHSHSTSHHPHPLTNSPSHPHHPVPSPRDAPPHPPLYHGTSLENAKGIMQTGWAESIGGEMGAGVYLAPSLDKAHGYAHGRGGSTPAVLEVRFAGRVLEVEEYTQAPKDWRDRYDAVHTRRNQAGQPTAEYVAKAGALFDTRILYHWQATLP